MVASLQFKKEALEAKLRDKTTQLKKLCIEEFELTGILPVETPLEPGESPPQIRRRVGTAFTLPESLINKFRSKEDEALAALELECKIQTGIAEAALGLANDGTVSKSVRRKHRVFYQESQRRLSELECRLNTLKQSQPKHKKKPRPPTEIDGEGNDVVDGEEHCEQARHPVLSVSYSDRGGSPSIRHSHTHNSFSRRESPLHMHNTRLIQQSHGPLPNLEFRHSLMVSEHMNNHHMSNNGVPIQQDNNWWWGKGRESWLNMVGYQQPPHSNDHAVTVETPSFYVDRFGSLDRNAPCIQTVEHDNRMSATLPRNAYTPNTNSVLLPGQTYPENSLMRTQSLGNMESPKHISDRKSKEKEWYESSLDSAPPRPPSLKPKTSISEFENVKPQQHEKYSPVKQQIASVNNVQFDTKEGESNTNCTNPKPSNWATSCMSYHGPGVRQSPLNVVVPYESPKNHTVVQAGKWQPYREVSKPFEMSDFYKYSTKYRKGQTSVNQSNDPNNPQLKAIYKPLQPLECQPLLNSGHSVDMVVPKATADPTVNGQLLTDIPSEFLTWYHDKNHSDNSRSSATLV